MFLTIFQCLIETTTTAFPGAIELQLRSYLPRLLTVLFAGVIVAFSMARADEPETDRLVQVLDLKPGSTVADVGAGSGWLAITLARRVAPNGTVYATEVDPKELNKIRDAVEKDGLHNVIVIEGTNNDTRLPANCCDAIFLRRVYHHITEPADMDRSLYQAMRPGGRLAVIDFEPWQKPNEKPVPGVPANRGGHGVPKPIVTKELTQASFVPVKTIEWPIAGDVTHFCILFKKPT